MYTPKHFEETDHATLYVLMQAHPFATLITNGADGLVVNHVPMLLATGDGESGTLRCHVARANPVWKLFSGSTDAIAVFQGPDAYISPSWYPTKREHGKAVPTWNYAVVHAHGRPKFIDDPAWLLAHVTEMSALHEAAQAKPWRVSDAPADFIDSMVKAIVGIEMPITKLEGKLKLSQNRPEADKVAVIETLDARSDDASRAMAASIKQAVGK